MAETVVLQLVVIGAVVSLFILVVEIALIFGLTGGIPWGRDDGSQNGEEEEEHAEGPDAGAEGEAAVARMERGVHHEARILDGGIRPIHAFHKRGPRRRHEDVAHGGGDGSE